MKLNYSLINRTLNISNVVFLSKNLSKIKNRITKIIICGNKNSILKSTIELVKNILGYNIEEIEEFQK